MANDLTTNPIFLDTASVGAIDQIRRYVKSVRWVSESASAGDNAQLKNGAGVIKWESVAAGANHVDADLIEDWWEGIDMDLLDTGNVYIYLG